MAERLRDRPAGQPRTMGSPLSINPRVTRMADYPQSHVLRNSNDVPRQNILQRGKVRRHELLEARQPVGWSTEDQKRDVTAGGVLLRGDALVHLVDQEAHQARESRSCFASSSA